MPASNPPVSDLQSPQFFNYLSICTLNKFIIRSPPHSGAEKECLYTTVLNDWPFILLLCPLFRDARTTDISASTLLLLFIIVTYAMTNIVLCSNFLRSVPYNTSEVSLHLDNTAFCLHLQSAGPPTCPREIPFGRVPHPLSFNLSSSCCRITMHLFPPTLENLHFSPLFMETMEREWSGV